MFLNHFLLADQQISLLFSLLEENTLRVLFYGHYFQTMKHKVFLLPENYDQLSKLSVVFVSVLFLLVDIYFS